MNEFPFVVLSDDFTHLLKINMQSTTKGFMGLRTYVLERRDLSRLIETCFIDIDKNGNVEKLIKAMGWFGVRNRLANIYLSKLLEGRFPRGVPKNHLDQILHFEERIKTYTVDGHSRGFLLAFYLKFAMVELKVTKPDESYDELFALDDLLKLLKVGGTKSVKIDWLLMMLNHFLLFYGYEACYEKLAKKMNFDQLWKGLDQQQQFLMTSNLLSYGASIQESEIFINDIIK